MFHNKCTTQPLTIRTFTKNIMCQYVTSELDRDKRELYGLTTSTLLTIFIHLIDLHNRLGR